MQHDAHIDTAIADMIRNYHVGRCDWRHVKAFAAKCGRTVGGAP